MPQPDTDTSIDTSLDLTTGAGELLYRPHPKQIPFLFARESNVFLWGNRGGGKSFTARMFAHTMAMAHPGFKYVIVRRSYPELYKTHLANMPIEMEKFGGAKKGFSYNDQKHIAYYPKGSMGYFFPCDNDGDVRKVLGAEAALVIFDEAPELEWEWMATIKTSIRVPIGSGFKAMTRYLGNPIGPGIAEIWRYCIDKDVDPLEDRYYDPADWRAIELRLEDNPSLPIDEYRKQFSGLPAHLIKAWLDGERTFERALFTLKPSIIVVDPITGEKVSKPYHVIDTLPTLGEEAKSILTTPWVRIYRAYDHGFSRDPALCLWFAVFGRRIICFKEKAWLRVPADEVARDILRESTLRIDGRLYHLPITATFCDPSIDLNDGSVVSIKDSMESQHIMVDSLDGQRRIGLPMEPSVNNREQFADAIHRALAEEVDPGVPRIQLLRFTPELASQGITGCPYLIKALPQMMYDEKNPLKLADHKHDHPVVTLAYFLMSHLPTTSPAKPSGRPWWEKVGLIPQHSRHHVLGNENVRKR